MTRKLVIILFVLIPAVFVGSSLMPKNPHSFSDSECDKCHVDAENNPKILSGPVTSLCRPCHKAMRTATHPVDVLPGALTIPSDMPLTDGRLTCNSCHNLHANRQNAFGEKSYYLRHTAAGGRNFCTACHERNPLNSGHAAVIGIAHVGKRFRVTDRSQMLDPMSIECLGCHDGTVGPDAIVSMGEWKHNRGEHPIGVNYKEHRMRKGGLRPISRLNRKIRLFAGNIGCGTCHDPFSKIPYNLVMSNDGSRLCIECHFDK